jgi:hypothetical protein
MKVSRYSVSGASHRSGTAATFCVMWLVTASSSTEPVAESASQSAIRDALTGSAFACASSMRIRGVRQATPAQSSAKSAKSHDHSLTWSPAARNGSITKG